MDVTVTRAANGKKWVLTDLLGRDMGCVAETAPNIFVIQPAGLAVNTFAVISSKKYDSLDHALAVSGLPSARSAPLGDLRMSMPLNRGGWTYVGH